jgi:hypothetical protein
MFAHLLEIGTVFHAPDARAYTRRFIPILMKHIDLVSPKNSNPPIFDPQVKARRSHRSCDLGLAVDCSLKLLR